MKQINRICLITNIFLISILASCSEQKEKESTNNDDWKKESQVLKSIQNINFNFPDSGQAYDKRTYYIDQCFEAIQDNIKIIGLNEFTDTIQVRFLRSREDMSLLTGRGARGMAMPHMNTLFIVVDGKHTPPIKHEFMHLIVMLKWGYPHFNSTWINEGLAALAENNCNGYNVAEIYRYFIETDKLIHIDLLISDFYNQSEMIGYHQSAYVVEYLLTNYSIDQFKRLWFEGFDNFSINYGFSFQEMKTLLDKDLITKQPKAPSIDWEIFKEGCN